MNVSVESEEQSGEAPELAAEPEQTEPGAELAQDEAPPEPVPDVPATEASAAPVVEAEATVVAEKEGEATSEEEKEAAPTTPKKQRQQAQGEPRKNQPTLRQVTARFAGCGRCSYFWAGYRMVHGMAALETAVAQSKSGWLELAWDGQMPDLIYKTYGVRLDIAHFHYEGCCKECRRHYIYEEAEGEEEAHSFRIEITPRAP